MIEAVLESNTSCLLGCSEVVTDFYGEWTDNGASLVRESHPAVEASVPRTRALVAGYTVRAGASSEQLDAVRLAVSEAVTNVVQHAYRGQSGPIRLSVAVVPGELWVLVADEGCGRHVPSAHPGLGWGLRLIASSCRELVLAAPADHGTEVRMRFCVGAGALCEDAVPVQESRRNPPGPIQS